MYSSSPLRAQALVCKQARFSCLWRPVGNLIFRLPGRRCRWGKEEGARHIEAFHTEKQRKRGACMWRIGRERESKRKKNENGTRASDRPHSTNPESWAEEEKRALPPALLSLCAFMSPSSARHKNAHTNTKTRCPETRSPDRRKGECTCFLCFQRVRSTTNRSANIRVHNRNCASAAVACGCSSRTYRANQQRLGAARSIVIPLHTAQARYRISLNITATSQKHAEKIGRMRIVGDLSTQFVVRWRWHADHCTPPRPSAGTALSAATKSVGAGPSSPPKGLPVLTVMEGASRASRGGHPAAYVMSGASNGRSAAPSFPFAPSPPVGPAPPLWQAPDGTRNPHLFVLCVDEHAPVAVHFPKRSRGQIMSSPASSMSMLGAL